MMIGYADWSKDGLTPEQIEAKEANDRRLFNLARHYSFIIWERNRPPLPDSIIVPLIKRRSTLSFYDIISV